MDEWGSRRRINPTASLDGFIFIVTPLERFFPSTSACLTPSLPRDNNKQNVAPPTRFGGDGGDSLLRPAASKRN